jgi:Zn-dependent alcohol dehydrogenase
LRLIDVVPSRLSLAADLGARHGISAREQDVRARVAVITSAGVDYVVETFRAALAGLRLRWRGRQLVFQL